MALVKYLQIEIIMKLGAMGASSLYIDKDYPSWIIFSLLKSELIYKDKVSNKRDQYKITAKGYSLYNHILGIMDIL